MPLTLQSRARRMQVFHLPHDVCCRDCCACEAVATIIVAENRRTGERARQQLTKKVPRAMTFLALERKQGLSTALLGVAEIKAAIDRGYLRVVEHTPDAAIAPVPSAAAGDSAPPSGSGSASAAASSSAPSPLSSAASTAPPAPAMPPPPPAASAPTPAAKAAGKEP